MPKRILYVHACAGMGGAPLSMLYLIERLDRSRYEPQVLFLGAGGEEVELFRQKGVRVHVRSDMSTYPHALNAYLSLRSMRPWEIVSRAVQALPSARRMRNFLESHPVDLVHLNTSVLIPCGLGARWARIPIVWHVREPLHPGVLGVRRWLVRECIDRCADCIIAISEFDATQLKRRPKVRVVYNFVDCQKFDKSITSQRFHRSIGLSQDRPLVTMLGGIVHSKGADILLRAAAVVRRSRPDVLFLIAGAPPVGDESPSRTKRVLRRLVERTRLVPSMERRVRDLMSQHNLEGTVRFVGMRSDIQELLAASAMLVWPASVSHFSRPIMEAGAMALPVIASDFPSSREQVRHGETGLLVPPSDPRALADAILHLLDHPDTARRMGEAGYVLARERHDARKNAESIVSIYEGILVESQPKETA